MYFKDSIYFPLLDLYYPNNNNKEIQDIVTKRITEIISDSDTKNKVIAILDNLLYEGHNIDRKTHKHNRIISNEELEFLNNIISNEEWPVFGWIKSAIQGKKRINKTDKIYLELEKNRNI